MTSNYDKLLAKLTEMFQLDQADLDFGIYRIMNSKRDEIVRFLEKDLLPQVKSVLATAQGDIGTAGAEELKQAEDAARGLGMNPDDSPKVRELRAKYAGGGDIGALEQEVFNHLYSFFRRYYDEGDFLSLRRYKEGVYAIPYEGEEVKLHWANADQYYIKTAEHFRDFIFKVGEKRVHFKLADAQTERDNNKEQEKRVFILTEESPVAEENGELIIRFEYRNDPAKRKQKDLTEAAVTTILDVAPAGWKPLLTTKAPTEKDPNRTILAKRLNDYTSRNTFDYFIHKDLGGFLRRELDFYIKNEVMHLDDIENEAAPKVEQYLAKVRAIRRVASKIIDFLAQLEEFQKALWLKKKFVVDAEYLITLDRVPTDFYPEIAANGAQVNEWVRLFSIQGIVGDTTTPSFCTPLSDDFLAANQNLLLSTRHFSTDFRHRLLSTYRDIDAQVTGWPVKGDNRHALDLMTERFSGKVKLCYIDPPYNTGNDGFVYKDNYQHSSWLSMLASRVSCVPRLCNREDSFFAMNIDKRQLFEANLLLNATLNGFSLVNAIVNVNNPKGRSDQAHLPTAHDNILLYATDGAISYGWSPSQKVLRRYRKQAEDGKYREIDLRKTGDNDRRVDRPRMFYPFYYHEESDTLWFSPDDAPSPQLVEILPMKAENEEGRWRWERDTATLHKDRLRARFMPKKQQWTVFELDYLDDDERVLPTSVWDEKPFNSERGTELLTDLGFEKEDFPRPKPVGLLEHLVEHLNRRGELTLDFFAGSGTTGHAVLNLNRKDGEDRRFILVEQGSHFDAVLIPRLAKAIYSDKWDDGNPVTRTGGISQFVKVITLESYEDSLANLVFAPRFDTQANLVEHHDGVREDFVLRYMLNAETSGSPSTLNVQAFDHPFGYKLKVAADTVGETKEVNVDLVETFNWLLGLRVHTMDVIRGFHIVTGRLPGQGNSENGDKALIIWRDTTENPNEKLDEFFAKQAYNTLDQEFDVIYVNGDNNLQNLRKDDQTWKVRLIEEEFHRLMWDVEDV